MTAQVAGRSFLAIDSAAIPWWPWLGVVWRGNLAALASAAVLGGFFVAALASRWIGGAIAASGAARFGVSALLILGGRLLKS